MHIYDQDDTIFFFDADTISFGKLPISADILDEYNQNKEEFEKNLTSLITKPRVARDTNIDLEICSRLVLVISQTCNLACTYCYADEGTYGEHHTKIMNEDTFKNVISNALKIFPKGIRNIQFFGGEPLVNFELIKFACKYLSEKFPQMNLEVPSFSIVTNGTLITNDIIEFFNLYNVSVTISVDGNKSINDKCRIFKSSNESVFDTISEKISLLNRKRKFPFAIEVTIHSKNIKKFVEYGKDILIDMEAISSLGPDNIHCVPVICDYNQQESIYHGNSMDDINDYFNKLTSFSLNTLLTDKPLPIIKTIDILSKIIHRCPSDYFCRAGITDITVDCNGDFYPCFVFINCKETRMASGEAFSINEFKNKREIYINNTIETNTECKNCWAHGFCSNCIGNSYLRYGAINKPIPQLCHMQQNIVETLVCTLEKYKQELLIKK